LRHVVPSQVTQRLSERDLPQRSLTQGLTELTADDTRKTVTLVGPAESVKTVEVEVEIQDRVGAPLRSTVRVPQDETRSVVLQRGDRRYTITLDPHINQDKTCSLHVAVTYQRESVERQRYSTSAISGFQRVAQGKPILLGVGALRREEEQAEPATIEVRLTPRVTR